MLTDDELEALTPDERADLAGRLMRLNGEPADPAASAVAAIVLPEPHIPPQFQWRRRWFIRLMVASCVVLIPWIVFLATTLPPRYTANHWALAWAGFDLALLLGLAGTAWAVWRRRQIAVLLMLVTATLLVTDAWFDVLTARGADDRALSLASALLLELPLAVLLFGLTVRILRLTLTAAHSALGHAPTDLPLWRTPMLLLTMTSAHMGGPIDPEPAVGGGWRPR